MNQDGQLLNCIHAAQTFMTVSMASLMILYYLSWKKFKISCFIDRVNIN